MTAPLWPTTLRAQTEVPVADGVLPARLFVRVAVWRLLLVLATRLTVRLISRMCTLPQHTSHIPHHIGRCASAGRG